MTERDGLFLTHILAAIADIESFTSEGRSSFMSDRKTQSAVVRQISSWVPMAHAQARGGT